MSLSIKNNIAALNAHKNMVQADRMLNKTYATIASGSKLNSISDNPTGMMLSEKMRVDILSREQVVRNTEIAVSVAQTSDSALNEINTLLVRLRQLAISSSNEAVNNPQILRVNQVEAENILETIDRISEQTRFASQPLLNGSQSLIGKASGEGLQYISSEKATQTSPEAGYKVNIHQLSSKSQLEALRTLSPEEIKEGGWILRVGEGLKRIDFIAEPNESLQLAVSRFNAETEAKGVAVEATETNGLLRLTHKQNGSVPRFILLGDSNGLFSDFSKEPIISEAGKDVAGTIGGEKAVGEGQYLTGAEGTRVEGLKVLFNGFLNLDGSEKIDQEGNLIAESIDEGSSLPFRGESEGSIVLKNKTILFHTGTESEEVSRLALPDTGTANLAKNIENKSGFKSLADIKLESFDEAQDSLLLLEKAIGDITLARSFIGSFQKNHLESGLQKLRDTTVDIIDAESKIKDTDMARAISVMTKQQLLLQTGAGMLKKAGQSHESIVSLIRPN